MVTVKANPAVQSALAQADQALRRGDTAAADRVLAPLLQRFPDDPRLLHLTGLVRMHQQRFADAAQCFAQARAADPHQAVLAFSHGTALRWLERHEEAAEVFAEAFRLKPDYAEAYFEAGTILQQLGRLDQAETVFRQWLRAMPGNSRGLLALAELLLLLQRPADAEPLLREALRTPMPPRSRIAMRFFQA